MLQKVNSSNQEFQLFQDNVDKALTPLQLSPLTGGRVLSDIALTAAQDNNVYHNLNYVPRLVLPFIPNAQSTIWMTASNSQYITLRCSSSCTVSLWVT